MASIALQRRSFTMSNNHPTPTQRSFVDLTETVEVQATFSAPARVWMSEANDIPPQASTTCSQWRLARVSLIAEENACSKSALTNAKRAAHATNPRYLWGKSHKPRGSCGAEPLLLGADKAAISGSRCTLTFSVAQERRPAGHRALGRHERTQLDRLLPLKRKSPRPGSPDRGDWFSSFAA